MLRMAFHWYLLQICKLVSPSELGCGKPVLTREGI